MKIGGWSEIIEEIARPLLISMPQTKIYGQAEFLRQNRSRLSDIIHACIVEIFAYPIEKRFQRFFPMEPEDFIYPADRSPQYIVIEISFFAGRTVETKKTLIRLLYKRLSQELEMAVNDIEIILYEIPKEHWGVRGVPGDELNLGYQVNV